MTKQRIAFVTHAMGPPVRGNGTTVARWMGSLQHRGFSVEAVRPGTHPSKTPDIVHGYHALHGGVWGAHLAREYACPLVVSLGGTDVLTVREEDATAAAIREVIKACDIVTGAFDAFQSVMSGEGTYHVVRRGVYLEADEPTKPSEGALRVLLVAGLRPVKDPLFAIELATRLRAQGVELSLRMLGPVLDDTYAELVKKRVNDCSFATLGVLPSVSMGAAYRHADVVWNTSLHEGGSNAALEALSHGCALAMRDVPGNRELIPPPDAPAMLFSDTDAASLTDAVPLVAFHRQIASESLDARVERWNRARQWLRVHHDPDDEADDLERAYSEVM